MRPNYVDVVIFRRGDDLIGQCLQFDLATQAKNIDQLDYELQALLVGHIIASIENDRQPFEGLAQAPNIYFEMFEGGRVLEHRHIDFRSDTDVKAPTPKLRLLDPLPPELLGQLTPSPI